MHRVTDTLCGRTPTGSPERSESPRGPIARSSVVPTLPTFEGLTVREGSKGPDRHRPSVPSFLIKDIESAANALRALEIQASTSHRPATQTRDVTPTPTELSNLQKTINKLTGEVRASRKELGKYTRSVEEVEGQIREIETELQKLSQPRVPEAAVRLSPVVDEIALQRRITELRNDVKHCKGKIEDLGLRHEQALHEAEIRAGFLDPAPGVLDYDVVRIWLSKATEPVEVGRRISLSDQQVEKCIKEFFGVVHASAGREARRAGSSGDSLMGNLNHLLTALSDEEFAVVRDTILTTATRSIAAKCAPRWRPLTAMSARMPAARQVLGSLMLTKEYLTGVGLLKSLLCEKKNRSLFNAAVDRKAEEFRALLKPPSESPGELLELQQAWETRQKAQRKTIEAVTAQLAKFVPANPRPAWEVETPAAARQERLRADLELVMTEGAKRADEYATALVKHTQRVSELEDTKARLDQSRTDLAEARGAAQRRRAENAEESKRAAQVLNQERDKLWQKVQPSLARVFNPEAMQRTFERHLELSEEALRGRLHPELTRATTYSSRSDLLSAVADVLKSAADKSNHAPGAERVVSHDRQIGHGLRLITRTGMTQNTVAYATSFHLDPDLRIAHMFPWIAPLDLSR